jgi:hypothetical protein
MVTEKNCARRRQRVTFMNGAFNLSLTGEIPEGCRRLLRRVRRQRCIPPVVRLVHPRAPRRIRDILQPTAELWEEGPFEYELANRVA